ncbi:MAG TPA: hypothetical protein VMN36_18200 [Verrucomicrobiales bacterium]|nr:hypothetical protein [Verrucomicrobiales bacterium]
MTKGVKREPGERPSGVKAPVLGAGRAGVWLLVLGLMWSGGGAMVFAALRVENFDFEPPSWEGAHHRSTFFEARQVIQDFGYSPATGKAGGRTGEIGGRIQPAAEKAYYGYPLPSEQNLDSPMSAEGLLYVEPGGGHCLLGFFRAGTLEGWRTPNTLAVRINGRGHTFHCHLEYCTSRWRANAGVAGEIVPGERVTATELVSGRSYAWKLDYEPEGSDGNGMLRFVLSDVEGGTAWCAVLPEHRADGAVFDHFGIVPVMKAWDGAGEIWVDNVKVNGVAFEFNEDPGWAAEGNRSEYITNDTRPKFDFGWSPTQYAGGEKPGELGGLIFRGDCREPERMACYGDRIARLTLEDPIEASGKVVMLRGVSDSTASIGFYHAEHSMWSNPSQKHAIPMDYLGINIEGPSSEGFFFYPVYRTHGDAAKAATRGESELPRIYPDGKAHDWAFRYDPAGAGGNGRITVRLDGQECRLELEAGDREAGATFNRFGICTPWIDGNSVRAYFDDLKYSCSAE